MWYGVCNVDNFSHKLYCTYDGPAKPVDDAGKKLLSLWCPNILKEHNNTSCCDNEQVRTYQTYSERNDFNTKK